MISATVVGRVGSDGELRVLPGGDSVLNFSVASNEGKGDKETTTWCRCALFGKRASSLAQYITKGKRLVVTGSLSERHFEAKGEKRSSLELRVNELEFVDSKNDSQQSSANGSSSTEDSSDIPF